MFKLVILLSYKSHVRIFIFSKFKLQPQLSIEASIILFYLL